MLGKAFNKAKELGSKGLHEAQRRTAVDVLNKTQNKVSGKSKDVLDKARVLVVNKYKNGGGVGAEKEYKSIDIGGGNYVFTNGDKISPSNLIVGNIYEWTAGAERLFVEYVGREKDNADKKVGSSIGKQEGGNLYLFKFIGDSKPSYTGLSGMAITRGNIVKQDNIYNEIEDSLNDEIKQIKKRITQAKREITTSKSESDKSNAKNRLAKTETYLAEQMKSNKELLDSLKDKKMKNGGGVGKKSNYKKFGKDNSRLVNFDIDDLDSFESMQYDQFSNSMDKADALQILINNVEGDYSQLNEELAEIAEEQYPSDEFFEDNRQYKKGGYVGKGELVWKKLSSSDKMNFLIKNFKTEITDRSKEDIVNKTYNFLPKNVKIKIESEYANVEDYANGGSTKGFNYSIGGL